MNYRIMLSLIALLAFTTTVTLTGCIEKEISKDRLIEGVSGAYENIDTYEMVSEMKMNVESGEAFTMSMSIQMSATVDNVNEEMHMTMLTNMPPMGDIAMEMYLVDDSMYFRTNQAGISDSWMKQEVPEGYMNGGDLVTGQSYLPEAEQYHLKGWEEMNGRMCYSVDITPNADQLLEAAISQGAIDPDTPEFDGFSQFMENMFRDVAITEWYDDQTFLPVKIVTHMKMHIDPELVETTSAQETGSEITMVVDSEMNITYLNVNKRISIELPPEAEDAILL